MWNEITFRAKLNSFNVLTFPTCRAIRTVFINYLYFCFNFHVLFGGPRTRARELTDLSPDAHSPTLSGGRTFKMSAP